MVNSIVHSAVARKMLCNPVNSLIADTEFACAVGMLLRILKADGEDCRQALENTTVASLQNWLLEKYNPAFSQEFDTPIRNLITMVRSYHAEEIPLREPLRELLEFGCQEEIHYPKGRFL